ncbi:MAG: hypothetical protein KAT43_02710 [Nanoarchaeota archaeon]|nr:hypothetical protein [Nanoarchaeota archaeon]
MITTCNPQDLMTPREIVEEIVEEVERDHPEDLSVFVRPNGTLIVRSGQYGALGRYEWGEIAQRIIVKSQKAGKWVPDRLKGMLGYSVFKDDLEGMIANGLLERTQVSRFQIRGHSFGKEVRAYKLTEKAMEMLFAHYASRD